MLADGLGVSDAAVEVVVVVVGARTLADEVVDGLFRVVLAARIVGRVVGAEVDVYGAARLFAQTSEVVAVDARVERVVVAHVPVREGDVVDAADGIVFVGRRSVGVVAAER